MLRGHRVRPLDIVRALSPGGALFTAGVVICLLLVSLGDALDSALLGEAGLEVGLFDLGGVLLVLVLQHWLLLQLLLAGGVLAAGLAVLSAAARSVLKVLRSTPPGAVNKIPISSDQDCSFLRLRRRSSCSPKCFWPPRCRPF